MNAAARAAAEDADAVIMVVDATDGHAGPERESHVLRLRFGLGDGRARTLEEIGQGLRVTRERVRQIEARALQKLRTPQASEQMVDYLQLEAVAGI